jgi:hypothetical protein
MNTLMGAVDLVEYAELLERLDHVAWPLDFRFSLLPGERVQIYENKWKRLYAEAWLDGEILTYFHAVCNRCGANDWEDTDAFNTWCPDCIAKEHKKAI